MQVVLAIHTAVPQHSKARGQSLCHCVAVGQQVASGADVVLFLQCAPLRTLVSGASQPRGTSLSWLVALVLMNLRLLSENFMCITESLGEDALNVAFEDVCEVLA